MNLKFVYFYEIYIEFLYKKCISLLVQSLILLTVLLW